ncbi:hypothetical protein MPTK1_7g10980 [Marchantia polymorpha subsp. ruderalis]|uniref:Uncharacterized protein n=2 Tax=Marchantia polymorpha TaxID=3197 RepID=A0AAF6BY99_MARPO|nr:hypothetical protein MARPO_0003s0112 [Marchantia polymorpha]BBN16983.1 hypothetical protein Mp_7g10980 [Marchantia polymorpha subsp. ruderalis]|eukprot:PTQ49220.1 hypothetical protein MARPO_0003s0112 [Marchantia polymorpha]
MFNYCGECFARPDVHLGRIESLMGAEQETRRDEMRSTSNVRTDPPEWKLSHTYIPYLLIRPGEGIESGPCDGRDWLASMRPIAGRLLECSALGRRNSEVLHLMIHILQKYVLLRLGDRGLERRPLRDKKQNRRRKKSESH